MEDSDPTGTDVTMSKDSKAPGEKEGEKHYKDQQK